MAVQHTASNIAQAFPRATNDKGDPDRWLPTESDRRLLTQGTTARLLTSWELSVQAQMLAALREVHSRGSSRIEVEHPHPAKGLLAQPTLVVTPVRESRYDADEIVLEITPAAGFAGSNLSWRSPSGPSSPSVLPSRAGTGTRTCSRPSVSLAPGPLGWPSSMHWSEIASLTSQYRARTAKTPTASTSPVGRLKGVRSEHCAALIWCRRRTMTRCRHAQRVGSASTRRPGKGTHRRAGHPRTPAAQHPGVEQQEQVPTFEDSVPDAAEAQ